MIIKESRADSMNRLSLRGEVCSGLKINSYKNIENKCLNLEIRNRKLREKEIPKKSD